MRKHCALWLLALWLCAAALATGLTGCGHKTTQADRAQEQKAFKADLSKMSAADRAKMSAAMQPKK